MVKDRPPPNSRIVSVLTKLKAKGSSENTLRSYGYRLVTIAKKVDLDKPDQVAQFISEIKGSNAYKNSFVKAYNHCVKLNDLNWTKPKYKYERKIPRIPTKEDVEKIIARSSRKYATIFRLLEETGAMPGELHNVTLRDLGLEKETLVIQGLKGHASRIFKLKPKTIAMLKNLLERIQRRKTFVPKLQKYVEGMDESKEWPI